MRRGQRGEWRWFLYVGQGWSAAVEDSSGPGATRYAVWAASTKRSVRGQLEYEWLSEAKRAAVELVIDTISPLKPKRLE